ncbi:thioredoxin-related protein [Saonia flava]|uniref:Thioredoxin-related protein n=1 Tax=Saonia flava TaxID=523696 RepID=A0A846QW30_9FLAO|nr:thioredoxin family protein [Saonia flava]NJB72531.1 thioredoxin-related protein [Saonia flava]
MKSLATVLLLFFSFCLFGQDWKESYDSAVLQATKENKPIVLVFSGSDWCAPCIKLDREIWQSIEFSNYALDKYVLYRADFPQKKVNRLSKEKQTLNNGLAEKYNPKGYFPLVVVLDENNRVLGTLGYENLSPKEYISRINSFVK